MENVKWNVSGITEFQSCWQVIKKNVINTINVICLYKSKYKMILYIDK